MSGDGPRPERHPLPITDELRALLAAEAEIEGAEARLMLDRARLLGANVSALVSRPQRWPGEWLMVAWLAHELGDEIEAVDVNPLVVTTGGAIAVDALVIPRR